MPEGATVDVNPLAPGGSNLIEVDEMDWGCPTIRVPGVVPTGAIVDVNALAPGGRAWTDVDENGRGTPT